MREEVGKKRLKKSGIKEGQQRKKVEGRKTIIWNENKGNREKKMRMRKVKEVREVKERKGKKDGNYMREQKGERRKDERKRRRKQKIR